MKPSILVSGGTAGIGEEVVAYFAPQSKGLGRRNGYDIGQADARRRIIELSRNYDIFFNHAHNGHFSGQTGLLYEVFADWEKIGKSGLIVSTGSFATFDPSLEFQRFAVVKFALDIASRQCAKKSASLGLKIRVTNLRPGMLDTLKDRSKPHWPGSGVRGSEVAKLIEAIFFMPDDLIVNEMVLTATTAPGVI